MSKLAYRTIGNEHPQGKPKVYFACHPDDQTGFLEDYALKILRIQTCAIWYETDYDAVYDREELEAQLSEMQLIVMPVTTKLLTSPNRAMDVEFAIAQEKHVPVLPIMLEGGLIDIFTKRFGNLQYIDPNDQDSTRRSFDEVLETYIRAVLVGDEMAKKVRGAFDAYIFLSYRKKDRAKAQKLMRLIHKSPLCQDIAIWYDEFLTPGEDYNDLIGAMLKKSDLFALAVTPNLINESNYVMTTEYPAARTAGKPVLPVEMEPTDRAGLKKRYEGIPDCIDGEDVKAVTTALQKLFNNKFVKDTSDFEHSFLIGMAYLDGIDVEVDKDRAVMLISRAAENGIPAAMDQLATMYETGKGVARDYHEGVKWRKKHVESLRHEFLYNPNETAKLAFFIMLFIKMWFLGDALLDLRLLDEAEAYYREMLTLSKIYEPIGEVFIRYWISISYGRVGEIAIARGKLDEAKECYKKSIEILSALIQETQWDTACRDLSIYYNKMGYMAEMQGRLEEAKGYYEKGLEICHVLAEESDTVETRWCIISSYGFLGGISVAQGRLEEAGDYYEKCLELSLSLAEETGEVWARRYLSVSYGKLGALLKTLGRTDEAERYFRKGYECASALSEETGTIENQRDLAISLCNLGDLAKRQGKLDEAKSYYAKSLDIFIYISGTAGTLEACRDTAVCYEKLGDIYFEQGELGKAKEYYEKSHQIYLENAEKTNTVIARRDLSVNYIKLGDVANAQCIEEVREQENTKKTIWSSVSRLLRKPKQQNTVAIMAKQYYEKALEIDLLIAEESRTTEARRDLVMCYYKLAGISALLGNVEEAKGFYENGVNICAELVAETPTLQACSDLQEICYNFGIFLYNTKIYLQSAKDMFLAVIRIGETSGYPQLRERTGMAKDFLINNFSKTSV